MTSADHVTSGPPMRLRASKAQYEEHPLAGLFSLIDGAEFAQLVDVLRASMAALG
jgi:hypothetical protein